ncbi:hypothetical protein NEUTE1DRAFT_96043 [Neurospora tetrasperma FGSC 2508]|uniref:Metallothionein n=1 Tax=Neurospora tetrasperma (strain FGSC 2508 / ATCC MYA-4615 / P0657) TaxID=510951 RepID=F8MX20_NEUT8|nr:uncharacterized protein NEUTE1DRAFT_96043 [Neurospora tetrasperma FGSC 2508]EGO54291.1 hypothetical protein NEUTE1DRAFT_96043 [Neurospora tetrasperma FGSC 2508]EGZ68272.1 hypothetical protein NEUTE2DRAFT_122565 [Neurospora tetrasperma FGSC 2509]
MGDCGCSGASSCNCGSGCKFFYFLPRRLSDPIFNSWHGTNLGNFQGSCSNCGSK